MKTYRTNFTNAVNKALELRKQQKEGLIISIADSVGYATGIEPNSYDKTKLTGSTRYQGTYMGGCCIVFPGDLSIWQARHSRSSFGKQCITTLEEFMENKGLLVRQTGNDLMLYHEDAQADKIASWAEAETENGLYETVFHVSIGMDIELVSAVCTKNSGKKVGTGLSELGITADEIISHFIQKGLLTEAALEV